MSYTELLIGTSLFAFAMLIDFHVGASMQTLEHNYRDDFQAWHEISNVLAMLSAGTSCYGMQALSLSPSVRFTCASDDTERCIEIFWKTKQIGRCQSHLQNY